MKCKINFSTSSSGETSDDEEYESESASSSSTSIEQKEPPSKQKGRIRKSYSSDVPELAVQQAEHVNNLEIEEDESSGDIPSITLPRFKVESYKTYALQRETKQTIRGKRFYYRFYYQGDLLFSAKTKTRHPDTFVPIVSGSDVHMKGNHDYELHVSDEGTCFHLQKSKTPDVQLSYKVVLESTLIMLPRYANVEIYQSIGYTETKLTTRRPKMSTRGEWILDFHNKFILPSQKNAIFIHFKDENGPDIINIRKIAKNSLEVDCFIKLPEIGVFAIGLCNFITRLK